MEVNAFPKSETKLQKWLQSTLTVTSRKRKVNIQPVYYPKRLYRSFKVMYLCIGKQCTPNDRKQSTMCSMPQRLRMFSEKYFISLRDFISKFISSRLII